MYHDIHVDPKDSFVEPVPSTFTRILETQFRSAGFFKRSICHGMYVEVKEVRLSGWNL